MTNMARNFTSWRDSLGFHVALKEESSCRQFCLEPVNSRGQLGRKENDLQLVVSRLVVNYFNLFYLIKNFRRGKFKKGKRKRKI
jgi:hypothetical protein